MENRLGKLESTPLKRLVRLKINERQDTHAPLPPAPPPPTLPPPNGPKLCLASVLRIVGIVCIVGGNGPHNKTMNYVTRYCLIRRFLKRR